MPASDPAMLGRAPDPIGEVLFENRKIEAAVDRLAREIEHQVGDRELILVAVLDGALIFAADLLRRLPGRTRLATVRASSYRGARTAPEDLEIHIPDVDLTGQHVLLVDDIVDTGRTLQQLQAALLTHRPASLQTCVLLDKPSRREVAVTVDWVGFTVPDRFVIGYGLDWDGWFRDLPYIAALDLPA